jgi:hypothetical protein
LHGGVSLSVRFSRLGDGEGEGVQLAETERFTEL